MGHINNEHYLAFQKRLDGHPQGASYSDDLIKIFRLVLSEDEAKLASILPMRIFSFDEEVDNWNINKEDAKKNINTLCEKGILMKFFYNKNSYYLMNASIPGFFEIIMMKKANDLDADTLRDLFYKYLIKDRNSIKDFSKLELSIFRTFPQEDYVDNKIEILDYEKISSVIDKAKNIGVTICFCRHFMEHKGRGCNNPQEVCLSFNLLADNLIKNKISRKISKKEAFDVIIKSRNAGLVQLGDNVQDEVLTICNCCSCCCGFINKWKKIGIQDGAKSNYFSKVDLNKCKKCGICISRCPVDAISINKDNGNIEVNLDKCLGCGVCARFCPSQCIKLQRKEDVGYVPKDVFELNIKNSIKTGKLQNFIFDNYSSWTHDVMRRLFKIIFSLNPIQKLLAQKQFQDNFIRILSKSQRQLLKNIRNK